LTEGTAYHVKAWASNQKGTSYGETRQFSSANHYHSNCIQQMQFKPPLQILQLGVGNVTSDGFATVTSRGVMLECFRQPNIAKCINFTSDGSGTVLIPVTFPTLAMELPIT
jgi:hypothetical protein